VRKIARLRVELRALFRRWRVQLALSVRVTVAALTALALSQLLNLPLPLWAVITAVIVTQMSVGRSLKASFDYLLGTLGGAVYGGAVAVFIPHESEIALLAVLAAVVGPLALVATINPRFAAAPVTGIIVLLLPQLTHASAAASAIDRVIEVTLGGLTGSVVSLILLPSNAHPLIIAAAARTLNQMARILGELLGGLTKGLDADSLHRMQDGIGAALAKMNEVGAEAEQERAAGLTVGPDTGPLLRMLLRLRHDLVIIGRVAVAPLPDPFRTRLEAPLGRAGTAITDYLRASAAALQAHRMSPALDATDAALKNYAAAIVELRREGLTRSLSVEDAERMFALGFALEQIRRNLKDLERCVAEWAGGSKTKENAEAPMLPR
jgi:uncharacterized membrane protein YccC